MAYAAIRRLQAGLIATLIMIAFRLPILRSLPLSANFWAQYVSDEDPGTEYEYDEEV